MTKIDALRILPAAAADQVLTRDQKRFNTLLRQIDQARNALKAWQDNIAQYGQAHVDLLLPLQEKARAARRQWILALDALLGQRGWTAAERDTASQLLCEAAGELLAGDDSDAELQALFAKHAEVDFDTDRRQSMQALKDMTESITGLDLGDDAGIDNGDDLLRRLHEQMQQQVAADQTQRETKTSQRRKTAAQQRREDDAQLATQSVREVFRKLASALHPDRETDATQRQTKTALMQQANQAYANNDLLTLLELQLRIEQVDAGHLAQADAQRIKHYNKVLAEQLDEIKAELARVEMGFRMDFDLEPGWGLNPQKLGLLMQQRQRELKAVQAQLHNEIALLANPAAAKRWLKVQRQALRDDDMFGLF
jgi:hypothetical protein